MAYIKAKDISQYQGNWQDTGEPIVMIKMSGGDAGLYMDSHAASNYEAAVRAGKAVGGYHFGGGVLTAEAEAAYFLKAMSPLAEHDVYALDVEAHLADRTDVVQWVLDFVHYVHDHISVWPMVYMSLSTLTAHDWSVVLKDCGLWLADWAVSPDAVIPTHYTYVMQQYSDGPNYDHDVFFGTLEQFKAYGYHTPNPAPQPTQEKPSEPVQNTQSNPPIPTQTVPEATQPSESTAPPSQPAEESQSQTSSVDTPVTGQTEAAAPAAQEKVSWFRVLITKILAFLNKEKV